MDNNKKKIFKLKNGISVLIVPTHTNLTDVTVKILLGENHERPDEMEITHYMEHLMARFTSHKYKDYKQISQELSKRGAKSNASVDNYSTNFYIQGFYKDIEYYLDLLSNTIHNFYLEKELIKQEKNAVTQELRNFMMNPSYIFEMKIWKYMYPKYAYQLDHKRHINHIQKYDTNKIYKFINSHILLKNTIVSISCPEAQMKKTTQFVKKYFYFKPHPSEMNIKYPIYQYDNHDLKILYVSNKQYKDNNAIVRLVVDGSIQYLSKEHLCMIYLQKILFNFETGIFYTMLRHKLGLIYNIHMYLNVHIQNPILSSYQIDTSTDHKNLPQLIKAMLDIVANLTVTKDDIEAARQTISLEYEFKKFHSLTSYNSYYSSYLLHKVPIVEQSSIQKKLEKITLTDIQNVLKKMKDEILHQGLIFYYAKKNMNNRIKAANQDSKMKYIKL